MHMCVLISELLRLMNTNMLLHTNRFFRDTKTFEIINRILYINYGISISDHSYTGIMCLYTLQD